MSERTENVLGPETTQMQRALLPRSPHAWIVVYDGDQVVAQFRLPGDAETYMRLTGLTRWGTRDWTPMSRRDLIAASILSGLLSGPHRDVSFSPAYAVALADEMIVRLDAKPGEIDGPAGDRK